MDVKQLGQVFTPPDIVRRMLSLRKNRGAVLEPSAGNGAFLRHLESGAVGLEIDPTHAAASGAIRMDFFDYPAENKFDTIIGNPPYVRHRDIPEATRKKLKSPLLDGRANLFLFFIEKCARHLRDGGELIFITPRDFLKLTAASRLNRMLHDSGTITDCIETGDARIFADASPNCAIWRFVKGDFSRRTIRRAKILSDERPNCLRPKRLHRAIGGHLRRQSGGGERHGCGFCQSPPRQPRFCLLANGGDRQHPPHDLQHSPRLSFAAQATTHGAKNPPFQRKQLVAMGAGAF